MIDPTEVETPMSETSTLEDMEREFAQPSAADDPSALPEEFKGMSAKDLAAMVKTTQDALKESETVRQEARTREIAAQEAAKAASSRPTVVHAAPVAPVDPLDSVTDEQIEALYASEDPRERRKAHQIELEINNRRLQRQFESRVGGMQSSAFDSALQLARAKHPEAFEIFSKEIEGLAATANPAFLGSVAQWEQLISLIQGQSGNIDRIFAHREAKKLAGVKTAALNGAADAAPFVPREAAAPSASRGDVRSVPSDSFDEDTKRIARSQFPDGLKTPWGTVGRDIDYATAYTRMANA